jgi:hypothetical protein
MTFDEWLDEIEVFGPRLERLHEDLNDYQGDNIEIVLKWLQAAYDVGRETTKIEEPEEPWLIDTAEAWNAWCAELKKPKENSDD